MKSPLILTVVLALALCAPAKDKDKPKHERNNVALQDDLAAMWEFSHDVALFGAWDSAFHLATLTAVNYDANLPASTRLVPGKVGNAVKLDGVSQHLFLESSAAFSHQGNPFTYAGWISPLSLKNDASVATSDEWVITTVNVSGAFYFKVQIGGFIDVGSDLVVNTVPLEVGKWYFLTFGWTGERVWARVNMHWGVFEDRTSLLPQVLTFYFGAGFGPLFHGLIDDTAIWRRAVSSEELRQIYNEPKPKRRSSSVRRSRFGSVPTPALHLDGLGLPFEEWDKPPPVCKAITCCD